MSTKGKRQEVHAIVKHGITKRTGTRRPVGGVYTLEGGSPQRRFDAQFKDTYDTPLRGCVDDGHALQTTSTPPECLLNEVHGTVDGESYDGRETF